MPSGSYRLAMQQRPRRNRSTAAIRAMARETDLGVHNLILPLFVQEGVGESTPIASMPGQARLSIDLMVKHCEAVAEAGVPGIALFPALPDDQKDTHGTHSTDPNNVNLRAVRAIKAAVPELLVITDVALDPYSSDGHDGVVVDGNIVNDESVEILAAMAVAQADAGTDVVAPSDMMDGRIGAIRNALDAAGHEHVLINSYCAKYASAFYGPFREALDSEPRGGDKKTYQMDPANRREALRELRLDELEGADWVMVKPGMPYLDVIRDFRDNTTLPVTAYQVSGEFAMLKAAGANGWIDYDACLLESLTSFRRAGADLIFTYAALEAAALLEG
ncbi:MAG TPA: porphobilinogen synthase [Acidimicrobiaceae bacterium]|nr:porphobilinogen synthase [Acidimicrobiaceae bacterium]